MVFIILKLKFIYGWLVAFHTGFWSNLFWREIFTETFNAMDYRAYVAIYGQTVWL